MPGRKLELSLSQRDKLRAYAYGLVVKRRLAAQRGLPGASDKFCLFVTKEEYIAIEAGQQQSPHNYQPIMVENLLLEANCVTANQQVGNVMLAQQIQELCKVARKLRGHRMLVSNSGLPRVALQEPLTASILRNRPVRQSRRIEAQTGRPAARRAQLVF